MSTTLRFQCAKCGSDKFEIPDDPKPDDTITCAGCGAQGRYGDIQSSARRQAKNAVEKVLGDIVKRFNKR